MVRKGGTLRCFDGFLPSDPLEFVHHKPEIRFASTGEPRISSASRVGTEGWPKSATAINFGIAGTSPLTECIASKFRSTHSSALAQPLVAIQRLNCRT